MTSFVEQSIYRPPTRYLKNMTVPAPIRTLIRARYVARDLIRSKKRARKHILTLERKASVAIALGDAELRRKIESAIIEVRELVQNAEFHIVGIGLELPSLCAMIDALDRRELVFDALNVNPADRVSPMVREYGTSTLNLIAVLDLENSGTKADDIEFKPLKWCSLMAMMHATRTNRKFDHAVHDAANEALGGALGEFRERPLVHRLVGI